MKTKQMKLTFPYSRQVQNLNRYHDNDLYGRKSLETPDTLICCHHVAKVCDYVEYVTHPDNIAPRPVSKDQSPRISEIAKTYRCFQPQWIPLETVKVGVVLDDRHAKHS